MTMRLLPTYKGYTVDFRLRQFRKADYGKPLVFIDFESPRGQRLLSEYMKKATQNNVLS